MAEKESRRAGTRSGASESGPNIRDGTEAKASADNSQRPVLPAAIATFEKNRRETVRVALNRFEGIDLIDIRCFAGDDRDIATKKGLSLRVALLPLLIDALQKAASEAKARGLIGGGT